jgi:glycosyltransferase involved in cell wall biosynthesis
MKIAVIAHAYYAIKEPYVGGLEAHTDQLVAELIRLGHDVTLFAKAGTQTAAQLVTIFRGNAWNGENPLYDHGYRRAMRSIADATYDVIINNGLNYIPLLLHTADMPPMITILHTPPFPKMTNVMQAQMNIENRCYIAVSDFTAQQWQPYCADRIQAIPNGMNLQTWHSNVGNATRKTAAWGGRITPEKGTHVAIQACIQAGIPLKIGGNIYDQNYFTKQVEPLLKNPLIEYVGHLDRAAINRLFAEASVVLVTPLWDEPFGLVAIEAWASGTPVAALPNGAVPSLVRNHVGSLASSDSANDLALAMQRALTANRSSCRLYAEENFSLTAMVRSYLALTPQIVNDESLSLVWQPA